MPLFDIPHNESLPLPAPERMGYIFFFLWPNLSALVRLRQSPQTVRRGSNVVWDCPSLFGWHCGIGLGHFTPAPFPAPSRGYGGPRNRTEMAGWNTGHSRGQPSPCPARECALDVQRSTRSSRDGRLRRMNGSPTQRARRSPIPGARPHAGATIDGGLTLANPSTEYLVAPTSCGYPGKA